jgi:hypothetical protein
MNAQVRRLGQVLHPSNRRLESRSRQALRTEGARPRQGCRG